MRAQHSAWLRFVGRVLDRRDRLGRFPRSVAVTPAVAEDLARFLPPVALRSRADGRVLVDLRRAERVLEAEALDHGRPPVSLEALFDQAAGRDRRNLRAEADHRNEQLRANLAAGSKEGWERACREGGIRRWVAVEGLDRDLEAVRLRDGMPGEDRGWFPGWRRAAREEGLEAVREGAARLMASFLLARNHRVGSLRLDDLSLAAAGRTKAFRPGGPDYQRLVRALLEADPNLAAQVRESAPGSPARRARLALERLGIVANESSLEILVQGPLRLEVGGQTLGDAARLAEMGMPARLTYGLVRRGRPVLPERTRVLTVENESAFHTLAALRPEDLIVYTAGHCSWSLILLLTRLSSAVPSVRFFHSGDLDRSGVLILRSLRHRTGLEVEPLWMDGETHSRCLDLSLPMKPEELERTRRLRERWKESICRDLVDRLAASGRWVEQEAVLGRLLSQGEVRI